MNCIYSLIPIAKEKPYSLKGLGFSLCLEVFYCSIITLVSTTFPPESLMNKV
jgi:hypothetical protein